jgi:hypothetical protein
MVMAEQRHEPEQIVTLLGQIEIVSRPACDRTSVRSVCRSASRLRFFLGDLHG